MRLFILLLLTLPFTTMAQDDTIPSSDDDYYEWDHHHRRSSSKRCSKTRYGLVDFGVSGLVTDEHYRLENGIDPFELRPIKSTNIKLHLVQQRWKLIDGFLALGYGLVLDYNKYFFDNPVVLLEDTPQVSFDFRPEAGFKKNRLSYWVLDLPLMMHIETNPNHVGKSLHLSAGAYAGMLLGANFKTKARGSKQKAKDNFGIDRWRYGLRAELGYGPCTLYGTYDLKPLFESSKDGGYVVTPFSLGLMLWPF